MSGMYEKVHEVLEKQLKAGDRLIVGVSGGPDSTVLLDVLVRFGEEKGVSIVVAHVNHGLRGRESDRDERFVKDISQKYGVPFFVKRVKISKKSHVEEEGRRVRRDFFSSLKKSQKASYIVTAHTQDDQLETIMLNFLRGSGPKGLAGMRMVENGFFKPFLGVSKKEILEYVKERKLSFRKDATNDESIYRRNFLRNKIMPLLAEVHPAFRETMLRNSAIFADIDRWLVSEAERFFARQTSPLKFSLEDFMGQPEAVKSTILQEISKRGAGNSYQLSFVKIAEILQMLERNIGKKQIICGKNRGRFWLDKGIVTFSKN